MFFRSSGASSMAHPPHVMLPGPAAAILAAFNNANAEIGGDLLDPSSFSCSSPIPMSQSSSSSSSMLLPSAFLKQSMTIGESSSSQSQSQSQGPTPAKKIKREDILATMMRLAQTVLQEERPVPFLFEEELENLTPKVRNETFINVNKCHVNLSCHIIMTFECHFLNIVTIDMTN
jgi:hypothetical protein